MKKTEIQFESIHSSLICEKSNFTILKDSCIHFTHIQQSADFGFNIRPLR